MVWAALKAWFSGPLHAAAQSLLRLIGRQPSGPKVIMGKPSLHPSFERIRRAEEHLANLRAHIAALKTRQEQTVGCDFDPKPPHKIILTDTASRAQPDMIVGILIGEVCYNLRSALDYLVYNLSWLDSGAPPTIKDKTQFPIESGQKGFLRREQQGWLKGINATHVANIKVLQPYKGCEWSRVLADRTGRDKHRELARLWTRIEGRGVPANHPGFGVALGHVRRAIHPVHGEMDVKLNLSADIEFADGLPVVEALEIVKLGVSDAIEAFKPDFP
jgi:hypothetical protein